MSQMDSMALPGYFFWTWKVGNSSITGKVEAPFWSYKLGLDNGTCSFAVVLEMMSKYPAALSTQAGYRPILWTHSGLVRPSNIRRTSFGTVPISPGRRAASGLARSLRPPLQRSRNILRRSSRMSTAPTPRSCPCTRLRVLFQRSRLQYLLQRLSLGETDGLTRRILASRPCRSQDAYTRTLGMPRQGLGPRSVAARPQASEGVGTM